MKCEMAQEQIVLWTYGELEDELALGLERHLAECATCQGEMTAMRGLEEGLAFLPVMEPSPNLLAQSRMRLDERLDQEGAHGFETRLRASFFRWMRGCGRTPWRCWRGSASKGTSASERRTATGYGAR